MVEQARNNGEVVEFRILENSSYWLPDVTHIFHGRDIFAPVAAHIAAGLPIEKLGSILSDPVLLTLPLPERTSEGWRGTFLHVDHFGNLTSNLTASHLAGQIELRGSHQ